MIEFTIEDVELLWSEDAKIDLTNLSYTQAEQFALHAKYSKLLNKAKKYFRQCEQARNKLIHIKTEYYEGTLAPQEAKNMGWEPNRRKIFKVDLDRFLAADEDIIAANNLIGDARDIVEFIESIIKTIAQKSFSIKNIIEDRKFLNGGN